MNKRILRIFVITKLCDFTCDIIYIFLYQCASNIIKYDAICQYSRNRAHQQCREMQNRNFVMEIVQQLLWFARSRTEQNDYSKMRNLNVQTRSDEYLTQKVLDSIAFKVPNSIARKMGEVARSRPRTGNIHGSVHQSQNLPEFDVTASL